MYGIIGVTAVLALVIMVKLILQIRERSSFNQDIRDIMANQNGTNQTRENRNTTNQNGTNQRTANTNTTNQSTSNQSTTSHNSMYQGTDNRNLTQTETMIYYANNPHKLKDYEFRFLYKKVDGYWRAYIIRMPELRLRNPSLEITHRIHRTESGKNVYWVCWDRKIDRLKDMQNISKLWADCLLEYIATGKRFG